MDYGNRNLFNHKLTFLVMDFNKPSETAACLSSIKQFTRFNDYEVVLLSNGGTQDYLGEFYNLNLIDRLILSKKNYGCGHGTNTLFNFCDTDYCMYVQNDQYMCRDFEEKELHEMIKTCESEYASIDLSGGAGHNDRYSERAHFINKNTILENPTLAYGGPGPFEHKIFWSEESTQNHFKKNNYKVHHNWEMLFCNNGRYSVREDENGNIERRDLIAGTVEKIS
jgi:hypothetical protein